MLKSVAIGLISTLIIFNSEAHANKAITLNSHESKQLSNPTPWTLKATCHIHGEQKKNKITVYVLENKGTINGKNLTKGQARSFTINNDDSILVSAEPGATVNITNTSANSVHAVCYT